jgi:hypothetical protein
MCDEECTMDLFCSSDGGNSQCDDFMTKQQDCLKQVWQAGLFW